MEGDSVPKLGQDHSYTQVLELNKELFEAQAKITPHLQMQPPEQPRNISRTLVLQRMQIQIFYHKAVCALNRIFLATPGSRTRSEQSRGLCIDSAMSLLSIQATMHQAGIKWYRFSITNHDFLLAAVILCLVLYTGDRSALVDNPEVVGKKDTELLRALTASQLIQMDVLDGLTMEKKIVRVMDSIVEKLRTPASDLLATSAIAKECRRNNFNLTNSSEHVMPAETEDVMT